VKKIALIALSTLPLLSQTGLADDLPLYPLDRTDDTTWTKIAESDKRNRLSVAALSTDGEKQMVFTFTEILGMEQFLGIFDAPAKTCGQEDGKTLTMNVPDPNRSLEVNGQAFPSAENCVDGYRDYSFSGVDAGHDITHALINGETVTLTFPGKDGAEQHTWEADGFKALAEERVRAYEEGARYQAYKGGTR